MSSSVSRTPHHDNATTALGNYPYLHSTRAELLRGLGRADGACAAHRQAIDLFSGRRFLEQHLTEL